MGSPFADCQRTCVSKSFGGKDSVKENRQGCLSRSIKPFFKLFESLKNAGSLSKNFFDKLKIPTCSAGGNFQTVKEPAYPKVSEGKIV